MRKSLLLAQKPVTALFLIKGSSSVSCRYRTCYLLDMGTSVLKYILKKGKKAEKQSKEM